MRTVFAAAPLVLFWAMPLLAALVLAPFAAGEVDSWRALFAHPQVWPGLWLSLFTGASATALALVLTLIILSGCYRTRIWHRLQTASAAGIALPHLSFAIGLGFLVMPSGLLARLVVGGASPPNWVSVHDPYGLMLIAVLALKETPFLVALGWSALSQGDRARTIASQWQAARSLGHGTGSAWLRIVQPQLLPLVAWPLVIVFAYGSTVVDLGLAVGPTTPPTLAVIIWRDLADADATINARGAAGAVFLTFAIAICCGLTFLLLRFTARAQRRFLCAGPSLLGVPRRTGLLLAVSMAAIYMASVVVLAMMSVSPRWPYPVLLPPAFAADAWLILWRSSSLLWTSLGLGIVTALASLAFAVSWLETVAERHDRFLIGLGLLSLALPQLLVTAGQYRLFLVIDLTGTLFGVFLAHLTPSLAYVLLVLTGPYRAFDQRFVQTAKALKASPWQAWRRIKAPMLKAPLLMAGAVGFAVSLVQFLPAQLIGAGRIATLPVEAVTLASGGDRPLTAAFALVLALPPLVAFGVVGLLGKPRWR